MLCMDLSMLRYECMSVCVFIKFVLCVCYVCMYVCVRYYVMSVLYVRYEFYVGYVMYGFMYVAYLCRYVL